MEEEPLRLFVGGLVSDISARDLQERFAPLGNVKAIVFPSSQAGGGHRGFAYVEFVPATDASLRKLFSAYNGCKWRGGLLRVEKAKEHYTDRLKREWSTDEALLNIANLSRPVVAVHHSVTPSILQKQVNGISDSEGTNGLKIFFPKLRKMKTIPLKGLGKHKRSFARVESTPLHLLSICANIDGLLPGAYGSVLKVDSISEADEISQAIVKERERQLDLLDRLFPNETPPTSLVPEKIVDINGTEPKGISESGDMFDGKEKPSSMTPRGSQTLEDSNPDKACHPQQRKKLDNSLEDDPTTIAFADERAKQMELMKGLFPTEVVTSREPEVSCEGNKLKKRRKFEGLGLSRESMSAPVRITEQAEQLQRSAALQSGRNSKARRNPDGAFETSCMPASADVLPKTKFTDKQEILSEFCTTPVDIPSTSAALEQVIKPEGRGLKKKTKRAVLQNVLNPNQQESSAVCQSDLNNSTEQVSPALCSTKTQNHADQQADTVYSDLSLEPDSGMTLNLGDDSMFLETAEEQEKHILQMMADMSSKEISEKISHTGNNPLPSVSAGEREQWELTIKPAVRSEVELEEDLEMTLNLGDDSISLETAQEQERQVLISMLPAYTCTRRDGRVRKCQGTGLEESRKAKVAEHSKEESEEPGPASLVTKRKPAKGRKQASGVNSCSAPQPEQPYKWTALATTCEIRATDGVVQQDSKPEPTESSIGRELSSEPGYQVKEGQKSLHQITEMETSQGQQLNELPPSCDQKLTRAAWKSLVGETGRVVFSLQQITGSSLPQVSFPMKQADDLGGQEEPPVKQIQSNSKLPEKSKDVNSKVIRKLSEQPHIKTPVVETAPITSILGASEFCPFMKSENAEKEWLASKSNLRSDYRAKHKQAAKKMNKLWSKGT